MSDAENFWKAHRRLPTMTECEDNNWAEGYNEEGELIVEFRDGSTLTDNDSTPERRN